MIELNYNNNILDINNSNIISNKNSKYKFFEDNPYKIINDKIFINEVKKINLEKDLKRIIAMSGPQDVKAQQYDKIGGSGSKNTNINDFYDLIIGKKTELTRLEKEIEELKRQKKLIEENFMTTLNSLERKVFKMRNKEMPIFDIAYKLNKSESHIKRVSANIFVKMDEWLKNLPKTEFIL